MRKTIKEPVSATEGRIVRALTSGVMSIDGADCFFSENRTYDETFEPYRNAPHMFADATLSDDAIMKLKVERGLVVGSLGRR